MNAYSIPEWCRRNGPVSRGTFYNLKKAGRAPTVIKVGARSLITRESDDAWRRRMEQEAADKAAS